MPAVQFSYFGYTATFAVRADTTIEQRRAEANERVIAKFGDTPTIPYVQPGLPFPDFVPMLVWDEQDEAFL